MAFTVPTFPILCNIFNGPWLTKTLRLADVPCNLGLGRRTLFYAGDYEPGGSQVTTQLLLPPLTDVRSQLLVPDQDVIECPAGSARWYGVAGVEDFGKGFPNEHRVAMLYQMSEILEPFTWAGAAWPVPMT